MQVVESACSYFLGIPHGSVSWFFMWYSFAPIQNSTLLYFYTKFNCYFLDDENRISSCTKHKIIALWFNFSKHNLIWIFVNWEMFKIPRAVNGPGLDPDPDRTRQHFPGTGRYIDPRPGPILSNKFVGWIRNIPFRSVSDPNPFLLINN